MTLGELLGREAGAARGPRDRTDSRACGRQPRGQARLSVRGAARGKTDGARFIPTHCRAAPRRSSCRKAARTPTARRGDHRGQRLRAARLALIAARFFGAQPEPSSPSPAPTARHRSPPSCARSGRAGLTAASLGTVGVVGPRGAELLAHTTPDPIELHRILAELADAGVTHLALEASATASSSAASTASARRRRLHQYRPATISTITRLRGLSRRQAAPVQRAAAAGGTRRRQCRQRAGVARCAALAKARGSDCHAVGREPARTCGS